MTMMEVEIKPHDDRVREHLPATAKPGDAGFDLIACIDEPIVLFAGEVSLIDVGFSMHIATCYEGGMIASGDVSDIGAAAILLPRSGQGHKEGLVLGNLVGLIDANYQGPVKVSAWNRSKKHTITIQPGQKLAQMVFIPVLLPVWRVVEEFTNTSERGAGGFGHTGKGGEA